MQEVLEVGGLQQHPKTLTELKRRFCVLHTVQHVKTLLFWGFRIAVWYEHSTNNYLPPCELSVAQELSENAIIARRNACETLFENSSHDAVVSVSDDAHFQIFGSVSKQNMRY
jgi:hypothetical protein